MLNEYKANVEERATQNIPPLPLDADQTSQLVELLKADNEESDGDSSESSSNSYGVPEHLLERSRAARARLSG